MSALQERPALGYLNGRTVLDAVPDAVLTADLSGNYLDANRAAEELLGYSRTELFALTVDQVVAMEPAAVREIYAGFVRNGSWRGEIRLRCKDGCLVLVEANASVSHDDNGNPLCVSVLRQLRVPEPAEATDAVQIAPAQYGISQRELGVLRLVSQGFADKQIALKLGVSVFTVNKHVGAILAKMKAGSRTEAGVRAIREGLI